MGSKTNMNGHWGPGAVWISDPEPEEGEVAESQQPVGWQMWETQGMGIINPAAVQRDPLLHRGEIRPQYLDMAATWNPPPLHQLAWEYNRRVNQSLTPSTWHEQTGRQARFTGGGVRGGHGPSILRTMYHALGPFTPEERAEAERRLREGIENIEYGHNIQQYLRERLSESLGEEVGTEALRSLMSDALENIREQLSSRSFVEHFMTEINIEEEEQRLRADLTAHQHPSGPDSQPDGVAVAEGDEQPVPVPDQGEEG